MLIDLTRAALAVNGRIVPHGAAAEICGVCTDSRRMQPGQLFVALKGPNFDGHDYAAAAAAAGAAALLLERPLSHLPLPQIIVEDTLRALGDLAALWRRRFSVPVCAVTGSSGKTTTKEMLAAILAVTGPGIKTAGNFNNLIGLPLTVFALDSEHRWAVLEMGMSERGEIARLAEIAAPQVGIITNVAPAHLASMKSLDAIARAKGELFVQLKAGACAVVNADDERVRNLPVANGVRRILYGVAPEAAIRAESIQTGGIAVSFDLVTPAGTGAVTLPVAGRHNVPNALAAAAAAYALDIPLATIVAGLTSFSPAAGRMEAQQLGDGITLIRDTYNANPLSMAAALVALDEIGGSGQRVALLADMLELGETSGDLHRELGAKAAGHLDLLVTLGEEGAKIAAGAKDAGMPAEQVIACTTHDEAAAALTRRLRPGDRVIIKGSRGMQTEKVAAALCEHYGVLCAGRG